MPLLLHAAQKPQKPQRRCTEALTKPVPKSTGELAGLALSSLWRRLFQSYEHFSQPGCEPFVRESALHGGPCAGVLGESQWASGFSTPTLTPSSSSITSTCDALIVHLFMCNEEFDVLSWAIAFCLIDRLHLHHYVRQRLQNISFWKPLDSSPAAFQLAKNEAPQLLFTVYTLAFKWHVDYTVSVKYLTNLLPHSSALRRVILRTTVKEELVVLPVLGYNCAVSNQHITQLMDHFLTAAERSYVLRAVRPT